MPYVQSANNVVHAPSHASYTESHVGLHTHWQAEQAYIRSEIDVSVSRGCTGGLPSWSVDLGLAGSGKGMKNMYDGKDDGDDTGEGAQAGGSWACPNGGSCGVVVREALGAMTLTYLLKAEGKGDT